MSKSLPSSYEKLQSNTSDRARWATLAEREISAHFEEWGNCQSSYDATFKSPKHIGSGTYGSVYKAFLSNKKYAKYPIAVKRSANQEINEARRMVLVSSIVEAGYNPHFSLLFTHFHCEEAKSRVQPNSLSYLESVPVIKKLQERYQELAAISKKDATLLAEYEEIPRRINKIIKERMPTVEEIKWISNVKHSLATKLGTTLESPSLLGTQASSLENSIRTLQGGVRGNGNEFAMFKVADYIFKEMVARRQESAQTKPYELFAMEYIDGQTLFDWIKSKPPQPAIISCIFQTCMALLSLLSYFGIVQNDLNMNNIMYNKVPAQTTYSYRIGDVVYTVPLHGHLFKVIDFGLSTNVNHKPYCEGAEWFTKCTAWSRDFLEFFYKLGVQYVYYAGSEVGKWCMYGYNLFAKGAPKSVDAVVDILNTLFSADVMKQHGLKPINTREDGDMVFDVVATQERRQQVMNIALHKRWIENAQ